MEGNEEKHNEKTKLDREKLKMFFDIPLDLSCICYNTGEIVELNPVWEEVLGYKREYMIGKTCFEFIHPDDIENTKKVYEEASKDIVNKYVNRIMCSDGSYKNFEWRSTQFGDYVFAAASDITKYIKTEKALKERENRYKKLVSNMSEGLLVIDKYGSIIDINESICKSTGYSREELLKCNIFQIDINLNHKKMLDIYNHVIEYGYMAYSGIHLCKSGQTLDVEVNAVSIEFDGIQYLLCTTRDVSDRKKSEEALRESECKFRTVVDQASDIIFVCSLDGRIEELNKAACENFKYDSNELLNTNIHDLILDKAGRRVHKFCLTDDSVNIMTEYFKRKDGYSFIGDARTKIIEIGITRHILTIIRDITEHQENEEKIKYLSFHDSLTGLYNRTFFEEEVKRLDTKRQLPISFIMGDVNGLKITNDIYGHQEGDHLLKTIAEIIKSSCRSEDIISRWGGDEYIVMLPCTNEKRAEEIYRGIKKKCSEYKQTIGDDVIIPNISLGLATKKSSDENIINVIKKAEDSMYKKKLLESRSMHSSLVESMRRTLYEKSFETEEHVIRINKMCHKIGNAMDLPEESISELDLLSMLHDIGKVAIDTQILNKKDKLTADEWDVIRRHSEIGYRITKSVPELNCIAEFILCHHERWDGKGYPQGLKGNNIPLLSRILLVADSYDALTEDRPYRKALSKEKAIEEIISNSGKQFDPEIVNVFITKVIE